MPLPAKPLRMQQPAIGNLVQELQHTMQLSQKKLADELGMTFATINRWENGHATPSPLSHKQIDTLLNQLLQSPGVTLRERVQAIQDKDFPSREKA